MNPSQISREFLAGNNVMQISQKVMWRIILRWTMHVSTEQICVIERGERGEGGEEEKGGKRRRGREREREREREKLFTESFIYRRQIDSLSDQSVRPARKPLWLPPMLFLFDYFSSSAAGLGTTRSHPPGFFLPSTVRRNKQLLSTFRPAKWEKAVGVQLATSLTGFARISTTEM